MSSNVPPPNHPFAQLGADQLAQLAELRRQAAQRQRETRRLIAITLLFTGFFVLVLAIFIWLQG